MSFTDWILLFFSQAGGTALGIYIILSIDEWKNK